MVPINEPLQTKALGGILSIQRLVDAVVPILLQFSRNGLVVEFGSLV